MERVVLLRHLKGIMRHCLGTSELLQVIDSVLVLRWQPKVTKSMQPEKKPTIRPILKSQVMDKLKDFLPDMLEANKKLQLVAMVLANFLSTPLAAGGDGNAVGWPCVAFDLDLSIVMEKPLTNCLC